tara:strand:- start:730 stop:1653 length:924 start_codon:yes stop_codon:yes gene_type:complete
MKRVLHLTFIIFSISVLLVSVEASALEGINVAVIDTGVDVNHPNLRGRIWFKNEPATNKKFGMDFSPLNGKVSTRPHDQNGHGTHIAGIIAKINPKARLQIIKYYNPKASGEENLRATIRALKYAIELDVDIINYSSGGPESSAAEKSLFALARKKGIIVVSAAGNEFRDIDTVGAAGFYPASYSMSNIITVGALDSNMRRVASSNWGKRSIDIFAPGKKIKSAFPNYKLAEMSGSSQATAFVTGAVSLIMGKEPRIKVNGIKNILFKTGFSNTYLSSLCQSGTALNLKKLKDYLRGENKRTFATAR